MFDIGNKVYCKSMSTNLIIAKYDTESKRYICINTNEESEMKYNVYSVLEEDLIKGWKKLRYK